MNEQHTDAAAAAAAPSKMYATASLIGEFAVVDVRQRGIWAVPRVNIMRGDRTLLNCVKHRHRSWTVRSTQFIAIPTEREICRCAITDTADHHPMTLRVAKFNRKYSMYTAIDNSTNCSGAQKTNLSYSIYTCTI